MPEGHQPIEAPKEIGVLQMSELTKESARRGKTSISESPQKLLSDLELHSTEHLLLHSFVGIHECRDI